MLYILICVKALKKVGKPNYWILLCVIKITKIVVGLVHFCLSGSFCAENVTVCVLFLQGMQNPVRSRPCPAARYFLKAVDFDIGGYLLFVFHGKPFQKLRENISNYSWQIEDFSLLRTCSHIIQVRIWKIFCCLFSVTYKINRRLHADFCQRAVSSEQGFTSGAVSVKARVRG